MIVTRCPWISTDHDDRPRTQHGSQECDVLAFLREDDVFRGINVDGFVEHCKGFTQDAIKFANDWTKRFETERDARIRERAETAGRDQKHIEAERAKARKVPFE